MTLTWSVDSKLGNSLIGEHSIIFAVDSYQDSVVPQGNVPPSMVLMLFLQLLPDFTVSNLFNLCMFFWRKQGTSRKLIAFTWMPSVRNPFNVHLKNIQRNQGHKTSQIKISLMCFTGLALSAILLKIQLLFQLPTSEQTQLYFFSTGSFKFLLLFRVSTSSIYLSLIKVVIEIKILTESNF